MKGPSAYVAKQDVGDTYLHKFSRSAPENPDVPRARIETSMPGRVGSVNHVAISQVQYRLGSSFVLRRWCFRICSRPRMSGSGTAIFLSKRPGRMSALFPRRVSIPTFSLDRGTARTSQGTAGSSSQQ